MHLNCAEGRSGYLAHDWCHSAKSQLSLIRFPLAGRTGASGDGHQRCKVTSHQAAAESGKRIRQNSMVEKDSAALNEPCL